jgi:hypothetical protein
MFKKLWKMLRNKINKNASKQDSRLQDKTEFSEVLNQILS